MNMPTVRRAAWAAWGGWICKERQRSLRPDAASVAGLLLTTEAMIAEAPKEVSMPTVRRAGEGGMGGMDM